MERGLLDIRTGEPFAARDRLHHREETTLVGATSATSPRSRSLVTARNLTLGGGVKTFTARDYVQDGLVAMLDGKENAGFGIHDDNATAWKDLAGTRNLYKLQDNPLNGEWERDCFSFSPPDGYAGNFGWYNESSLASARTIEIVARFLQAPTSGYVAFPISWGAGYYCSARIDEALTRGNFYLGYSSRSPKYEGTLVGRTFSFAITKTDGNNSGQKAYINGAYCNSTVESFMSHQHYSNSRFAIGGYGATGTGTKSAVPYKVYCVRMYDSVLTADEISENYDIDNVRFDLA